MRLRSFNGRSIGCFALVVIAALWIWSSFSLSMTTWHPDSIVFSPNEQYQDNFGAAIAADRDTIAVGAPGSRIFSTPGAAYVYVHSNSTWQLQAKLMWENSQPGLFDGFAKNVDISRNTIALTTDQPALNNPVYIFERQGSTWTQQAKLELPEISDEQKRFNQFTDDAVAIDGNTLVIGAEQAAYVYTRDASTKTWTYEAQLIYPNSGKLAEPDKTTCGSAPHGSGLAVAISGNTIVVGDRNSGSGYGVAGNCANIFVRQPTTRQWIHQASLLPDTCQYQHSQTCKGIGGFGYSVAIDKDTVVVGTVATVPGPFVSCEPEGGDAAYIFERTPVTKNWRQTARLKPRGILASFNATRCGFGEQVAISGDAVLTSGVNFGAAPHLFKRDVKTGQWRYQAQVSVERKKVYRSVSDDSARSLGISNHYVVIGDTTVSRNKQTANRSGALYLVNLQ